MKVDLEDGHEFVKSPAVKTFEVDPQVSSPSEAKDSPCSSWSYSYSPLNQKSSKVSPGRKSSSGGFVYRIRDHVRMGSTLTETVKGKLSLTAKIVKAGGRENIFKQIFGVADGEKLLKASQCYLFTTAGPIAGILFISTLKVGFCSERSISIPMPASATSSGQSSSGTPYKVVIPITKIKRANESENVNKPAEKYIEIVTEDDYEFWFMGFVRYEKALINLQKAISLSNNTSI